MGAHELTHENLTVRIQLPQHVLRLLGVGASFPAQTIDRTNGRVTLQIPVGQLKSNPDIFYTFEASGDVVRCAWASSSRRDLFGSFKLTGMGHTQESAIGELEFAVSAALAGTPIQ